MTTDGAHLGLHASTAMKAIIGGDQPTDEDFQTVAQMRDRILAQPLPVIGSEYKDGDYDAVATYIAKIVLTRYLADRALASVPTEAEYDWDADPDRGSSGMKPEYTKSIGLWQTIKPSLTGEEQAVCSGMSGFMWGWAVNAARRCVELPPVANPAIMVLGQ